MHPRGKEPFHIAGTNDLVQTGAGEALGGDVFQVRMPPEACERATPCEKS